MKILTWKQFREIEGIKHVLLPQAGVRQWHSLTVCSVFLQCHLPTQQCRQLHCGLSLSLSPFHFLYTSNHQRKHIRANEASQLSMHSQKIKSYANGWRAWEETAVWDDGKADHIIQHYRSNEAVIFKEEENSCPRHRGENLLAVWDHQEFIQVPKWISWDVYFASPFTQISRWRDFIS